MQDFSLHVLDICENSIKAGAKNISVSIFEDEEANRMTLEIIDDGSGMDEEFCRRVLDPFVTTRTERRVGLGLPLLSQAAQMCEGEMEIDSKPGKGARVHASFRLDHIDLKPLGDMGSTIMTLIAGHPEREFVYRHCVNEREFLFETAEIRRELDGVPLNNPEVLNFLRNSIREGISEIK